MYSTSEAGVLGGLLFYIIGAGITLALLFVIVKTAVTQGMNAHYKTVRRFEATQEWRYSTDGKSEPLPLEPPAGS